MATQKEVTRHKRREDISLYVSYPAGYSTSYVHLTQTTQRGLANCIAYRLDRHVVFTFLYICSTP